jgi:lipoprotein signal peptidase
MLYAVAIAMVISGGIGNMIDRLGFGFYVNPSTGMGEVIDFIAFPSIWDPIFNGADSFVCVGAGILILSLSLELAREIKAERSRTSGGDGKN